MRSTIEDVELVLVYQTDGTVEVRVVENDDEPIWVPKPKYEIDPASPVRGQWITLTAERDTPEWKGLV